MFTFVKPKQHAGAAHQTHIPPPAICHSHAGCLLAELATGLPLFPGESDMDQLWLILRCFGKLCDTQTEWLKKHTL